MSLPTIVAPAVLAALLTTAAYAQSPAAPADRAASTEPPPLRFREAVDIAVSRDPSAKAIAAAVTAARARPALERELMPPMVDLQAWEWPLDQWNPRYVQWMVGVQQEFPGKGKRTARAARMEAEANVMANEARASRRSVAAEVGRAYVDLRVAREELATIDAARAIVRQSVDASEARYAAGRSSQQDTLAGIVELSRLAQEDVMARERERMTRSRLNVLLGRDPDEPIGAIDPAPDESAVPKLADIEARLKEIHPEMTAIDRARDLADADLAVARVAGRPDYLVEGGYMWMPSMRDAIQFKVGMTWPNAPWVKRRVGREAEIARADSAAAEARRDQVAQQIRLTAQESIVRASAAAERAEVLRTTVVPPTEHAWEVARIAYLSDRAEFMPLVDAQRVLLNARLEISRALGDRDRALAELRVLMGEFDAGPATLAPPD